MTENIDLSVNRPASKFFLCQRRHLVPTKDWLHAVPAHFEWMGARHAEGSIVMSGPGRRLTGDRAGEFFGQYLIRARSQEEALAIAASDPITEMGLADFDLVEWEVHQILGIGPFSLPGIQAMFGLELPDD